MFFSSNALKCVSMNNQKCKMRLETININTNVPSFYPYNILVNNYIGSFYNINGSYAKLCVSDIAKNIDIKVFNLMSRTNKTSFRMA